MLRNRLTKKRKEFNVIRFNISYFRRENKNDETFLRSNVLKFIKKFEKSNDELIEILNKNFHRNRRIIQIAKTTKNIEL